MKRAQYTDGTRANPVRCHEFSEACDVAVERDRPTTCAVIEPDGTWTIVEAFPSRDYRILGTDSKTKL